MSETSQGVRPLTPMHDRTILVLQGGGALGAYQAGAYEGMVEQGIAPDWVTGVSIGAINGALIAGNPAGTRVDRLREFWDRVSSGVPGIEVNRFDPVRIEVNRLSAATAATFGVPGFFTPRIPPALFAFDGTPQALSVYDTAPLRATLEELIDFDYLNREGGVRLSMGAVNVRTGNSIYFDSLEGKLTPEHIMASGSLPPGFPPVVIDGEHYWDGGIVSNSPLSYVLDDSPDAVSARLAARENAASEAAAAELASALRGVLDQGTRSSSSHFAELLQRSAMASLAPSYRDVPDGGVKRAGFYVLAGARMPAVLFETSFISNPVGETRFNTGDFRQKMADAIVNAVRAYKDGH